MINFLNIILLAGFLLFGCTMGPKYEQPPEMDIPEEWHYALDDSIEFENADCFVWWESLNDPILNGLIKKAAIQNNDLLIAGTRIMVARYERMGKRAEQLPHVDASMTAGHLYYSKDALVKGILGKAICSHQLKHVNRNVNFFEIGFDASWEIDLFGATRHQINALEAKAEAEEENLIDVWVTLSAEIARNYVELRNFQQRRILLLKKVESQKDLVHLTEELVNIGLRDRFDLLRAEEHLNNLLAEKPLLELGIDKTIHHIAILLGQPPGDLFVDLCESQNLPSIPCEKPLCLPSDLLRRRPDIRRAERNLAAATEMVGSAVASLFPRISLMGFVGQISTQLKNLLNGSSTTWFVAPQLLMPIFNSKLLTQDVNMSKVQSRQALFEYQKTVLQALEEVENSIASFQYETERNHTLEQIQLANEESHQLMLDLYERGIKDYLEVQQEMQQLIAAEDTHLQSQTELLIHYISLYKALGGGWEIPANCDDECDEENLPES